ncbi:unnamed protein product [Rotaria sp. Silwood2]|nr:unnamed protein product [Rotaria sp. Silwood2]
MLADAGVDTLICDGTNAFTHDNISSKIGRGLNEYGHLEQTCVTAVGHPVMNIGQLYDGPTQHESEQINPMISSYFSQQWEQALKIVPPFIFVTGWNEWIAQHFIQTSAQNSFIEYSRDIEPMFGGHQDNYYYQLLSYICRFKGMLKLKISSSSKTIQISQDFSQWNNVTPYYLDDLFDIPSRNHSQYGNQSEKLINYSQRNDLERMQIARDEINLYFLSTFKWTMD